MLLLTLKTPRFLLIFLLVAATLSTAYSVQGGEECSFAVAERKMMQSIENKMGGGNMVSDDYNSVKMDLTKEKSAKSKYSRKSSRKMMLKENYRARFAAFTADYKGPRRHPPKNN